MVAFYRDVLGMQSGPRPNFSFDGAWMYVGQHPVVHLVKVDEAPVPGHSLRLEHFALAGRDLRAFVGHLDRLGVPHREGRLHDFRLVQINVHDPDGNHIHIDFPLE
jgi:catechol-2,3-dioxygenase